MFRRLAEFAPFRNWSPVRESLEEKYPATYEGIDCMEQFALLVEDREYLRLLWLYRRVPSRFLERWLTKALGNPKRGQLYETILRAIEAESGTYEKRDYGADFQRAKAGRREPAPAWICGDIPGLPEWRIYHHRCGRTSIYSDGVGAFSISDLLYGISGEKKAHIRGQKKREPLSPEK